MAKKDCSVPGNRDPLTLEVHWYATIRTVDILRQDLVLIH